MNLSQAILDESLLFLQLHKLDFKDFISANSEFLELSRSFAEKLFSILEDFFLSEANFFESHFLKDGIIFSLNLYSFLINPLKKKQVFLNFISLNSFDSIKQIFNYALKVFFNQKKKKFIIEYFQELLSNNKFNIDTIEDIIYSVQSLFHDDLGYYLDGPIRQLLLVESVNTNILKEISIIYRRLSDSLNLKFSKFSFFGPYLTKIAGSLHISKSVFANCFIPLFYSDFSNDIHIFEKEGYFRCYNFKKKNDFSKTLTILFKLKDNPGVNEGFIIEFFYSNNSLNFIWYLKTHHLAYIPPKKGDESDKSIYSKAVISISSIRFTDQKYNDNSLIRFTTDIFSGTALEVINTRFIDLREPFVYSLIEYLDIGPQSIFFINLFVFGGFKIMTKSIDYFQSIASYIDLEKQSKLTNDLFSDYKNSISVISILKFILMINDLNGQNFGVIKDSKEIKIIDFAPPDQFFADEYDSDGFQNQNFLETLKSDFLQKEFQTLKIFSVITQDEIHLDEIKIGAEILKNKIENLIVPIIDFFTSPQSSSSGSDTSLFYEKKKYSGCKCTFSDFINSINSQIQNKIFKEHVLIDNQMRKISDLLGYIETEITYEYPPKDFRRYSNFSQRILNNYVEIINWRYEKLLECLKLN